MKNKKNNIKILDNFIDISNIKQLPVRLQRRIQKYGNSAICPTCKKLLTLQMLKDGKLHCCNKCRSKGQELKQLARKSNFNRDYSKSMSYFSTEKGKEHIKKVMLEKYGVDNPFKNKNIQTIIKQKNLQKYGVQCIFQKIPQNISNQQKEKLLKSKRKIKETNIQKYGVEYPLQNQQIKEKIKNKIKENNFQKFGNYHKAWLTISTLQYVQPLFNQNEYVGLNKEYMWKCKYCGNQFKSIYNSGQLYTKCQCQKLKHTSIMQEQLSQFCKEYYQIKRNWNGLIWPQEIDIVISQIKLAIQFNGLYWHQIQYKDKFYHYQKSIKCRQKGYRLIHIWQDQWVNNKEEIKQKLIKVFNKQQKYENNQIVRFDWNNVLTGKLIKDPFIEERNKFLIFNCGIFQYIQFK